MPTVVQPRAQIVLTGPDPNGNQGKQVINVAGVDGTITLANMITAIDAIVAGLTPVTDAGYVKASAHFEFTDDTNPELLAVTAAESRWHDKLVIPVNRGLPGGTRFIVGSPKAALFTDDSFGVDSVFDVSAGAGATLAAFLQAALVGTVVICDARDNPITSVAGGKFLSNPSYKRSRIAG